MTLQFQMALVQLQSPSGSVVIPEPSVFEDEGACLQFICEQLASRNFLKFHVSGFGDLAWPVDVRTDLCVIMEQIIEILGQLRVGVNCSLDFYEQGIERRILFTSNNDTLLAECLCDLSWTPVPSRIMISRTDFLLMLDRLVDDFLQYTALLGSKSLTFRARSLLKKPS